MISEKLERGIVMGAFTLMFIGLIGVLVSMTMLQILDALGSGGFAVVTTALLSDASFIFGVAISIGAILFIIEYVLHRLGLAHDPMQMLKKQ